MYIVKILDSSKVVIKKIVELMLVGLHYLTEALYIHPTHF